MIHQQKFTSGEKSDMAKVPSSIVVDASVGVKWYSSVNEKDLEKALILRDKHLNRETSLIVPDLFFVEVINALKYNTAFKPIHLERIAGSLFKMELIVSTYNEEILKTSALLASKKNISVYDATYVALAQLNNSMLVTSDKKLVNKLDDNFRVSLLSDFPI